MDLIVLSNADDDHVAGLVPVLERYDVRQIIQTSAPAKPTAAYLKWRDLVNQKHIPVQTAQPGSIVMLDRDVALEIVYANSNAQAGFAIVQLRAGNFAALFADSAALDDQEDFLASNSNVASSVLVAPRRIAPGLVEAASPQLAIWFGSGGARGTPSPDWLSALATATILRTDERGNIEIITDGKNLSVRTTR